MSAITDMNHLVKYIENHRPQNVVILSGAGVSTNCGLPDYRSGNGKLLKILTTTKNIYAEEGYAEFVEKLQTCQPTLSHYLAYVLYDLGILRRVYTQNIDGLYQKAGLPEDMIVEFHGSVEKKNIVTYGTLISQKVIDRVVEDFIDNPVDIDLIIVMGTSLQVAPFCALPNLVSSTACRVLVDRVPSNAFTNAFTAKKSIDGENQHNQTTKFGKRKVTLKSTWSRMSKGKWKNQYVIESDTDDFSDVISEAFRSTTSLKSETVS